MNTKEVNSYHENALHQAIKKHTPTKRDPSFYSWYERDPATLNVIEKRTARVGSSPDAVTKAAQFKQFYRGKYQCISKTFNVQGFWQLDTTHGYRIIRVLFSEAQSQTAAENYVRQEYYSLTLPDLDGTKLLSQVTIASVLKNCKYDNYKDTITYTKPESIEAQMAIKIQSRLRGHFARKRARNTHKVSNYVKIKKHTEKQSRWSQLDHVSPAFQRIKHKTKLRSSNGSDSENKVLSLAGQMVQTWKYKNKGVTETSEDELMFLKKRRMANQARNRWRNAKTLLGTTARVGRFEKLDLVGKKEESDNIFYQSKFDKVPHVSTTRALPSSRRWEWQQSLKVENFNDPYLVFSDYKTAAYEPDDIAPVSRRNATPVNKLRFQISTTHNIPKGNFGEISSLSPSKSRSLLLQQRQQITTFKPL